MTPVHSTVLPKRLVHTIPRNPQQIEVSKIAIEAATLDVSGLYKRFATRPEGLTAEEARKRLSEHGPNALTEDHRLGIGRLLGHAFINPLVILLAVLAGVSFATGDFRAGSMMSLMIAIGVGLKLVQEARADSAAAKLKAMISVTATVLRDGQPQEIAIAQLVPGDVVTIAAGDMIPADIRLVAAKDLFVVQSSLTGESFPVEKFEIEKNAASTAPVELETAIEKGTTSAVGREPIGNRKGNHLTDA